MCASSTLGSFYLCDRGQCIEERKNRKKSWFDEHKDRTGGHDSWWYVIPGKKKKIGGKKEGKRE